MPKYLSTRAAGAVPILPLTAERLKSWLTAQPATVTAWVESLGFAAKPGTHCLLPGADGALARVLAGVDPADGPYAYAGLPAALPPGRYRLEAPETTDGIGDPNQVALGWALGSYSFARYRKGRVATR